MVFMMNSEARNKLSVHKKVIPPSPLLKKSCEGVYLWGERCWGLRLEFTNSIPDSVAQRFRNVFPYAAYEHKKSNDKGLLTKRKSK